MNKIKVKVETANGKAIVGKSQTRNIRCAPRKVKLVVDLIRNKTVGNALDILTFTHRPSATPYVIRALKAAAASAAQKHPEPDSLVIGEAIVNCAPMLKRIRPASMGRAVRVRKRQTHLFLALTEN
ncbi:50S ribosomal protein L22 [soil metagenome]